MRKDFINSIEQQIQWENEQTLPRYCSKCGKGYLLRDAKIVRTNINYGGEWGDTYEVWRKCPYCGQIQD